MQQLTGLELVTVLNMLPKCLLVQRLPLAGHQSVDANPNLLSSETMQKLTAFQLVAVLNMLPEGLLVQTLALAGHMAGLCRGLLQHQAAAVIPNAPHHIQPPWGSCHNHLILQPAPHRTELLHPAISTILY